MARTDSRVLDKAARDRAYVAGLEEELEGAEIQGKTAKVAAIREELARAKSHGRDVEGEQPVLQTFTEADALQQELDGVRRRGNKAREAAILEELDRLGSPAPKVERATTGPRQTATPKRPSASRRRKR